MANPIKVVKTASKIAGKAMRGKKNSKGFKETNVKDLTKVTTGMYKAGKLAGKAYAVPAQGNKQGLKGSNRDLKKLIKKAK